MKVIKSPHEFYILKDFESCENSKLKTTWWSINNITHFLCDANKFEAKIHFLRCRDKMMKLSFYIEIIVKLQHQHCKTI